MNIKMNVKRLLGMQEKTARHSDTIPGLRAELCRIQTECDDAHRQVADAQYQRDEARQRQTKAENERDAVLVQLNVERQNRMDDHLQLVADVFCEMAASTMDGNRHKSVPQRIQIKATLIDQQFRLSITNRVPLELQNRINDFDDEHLPEPKSTIVMEQHITHYVDKAEPGSTAITIYQEGQS